MKIDIKINDKKVQQALNYLVRSGGKDYAIAGTNVIYAATHQFGAEKGSFGSDRHGRSLPLGRHSSAPVSWPIKRRA